MVFAVTALGHNDQGWLKALTEQAGKIHHASNMFHTRPPLELARFLVEHSSLDKVFFCNSGTEANEAALKFARKYQSVVAGRDPSLGATKPPPFTDFGCMKPIPVQCRTENGCCDCWPQASHAMPHRTKIVAFKSSFHGRSMGSLSMTHKPRIRQPFAPLPPDVSFAEYNDIDSA